MLPSFPERIRNVIAKFGLLAPGDRVLIGLSGGADSVCLLRVLRNLGYDVSAAHLNHRLRGPASDEDERFAGDLARVMGVPFFSRQVRVGDIPGNLEAAGRTARRLFFEELLREQGFDRIALAHHRGDRIETFLLNLIRGSGMDGLSAMAPAAGNIVRPLIEATRQEIEEYLRGEGQEWRTDASNLDLRFTRNRIRHEVLPSLNALNPHFTETLSRTAEILQEEDRWMAMHARAWMAAHGAENPDGWSADAVALAGEPAALVRRVVRSALRQVRAGLSDISFDHVEAVRTLLQSGKSGRTVELPGGIRVCREFGWLTFKSRPEAALEFAYDLPIPGDVHIPEIGRTFRATVIDRAEERIGVNRVIVDGSGIGPYVKIRNWKPGDYYKPVGWPSSKLKKLFQLARVPRSQRSRRPVFVSGATIIWVVSFPISRDVLPGEQSQKIVAFDTVPD